MTRSPRPILFAAALLAASVALSGCGRKADPELPTVEAPAKKATAPVGIPVGLPSKPAAPPKPENKAFFLDFLL